MFSQEVLKVALYCCNEVLDNLKQKCSNYFFSFMLGKTSVSRRDN